MPSNLGTWEDVLRERVVHSPTREAEAVNRQTQTWNTLLPEDEDRFELAPSRPSRHRTSWSRLFSGRASSELSESIYEAFPEDLLVYGPVVRIVSSFAIDLTESPDLLPPLDVKFVRVAEGPVVTPARPKDPLPRLDSEIDVLMAALEIYGCEAAAARIQEFLAIREEDPDEPPINRESLLSLVQFLIQEPQLLPPVVSSDLDGLMEIEWHLLDNGDPNTPWGRGNGVVSLKFLKSGNIQYVALSGPRRRGQNRLRVHGEATKCEMLAGLGEFAQKITTS